MIELRHLRYFIAVAEDLNIRHAAERVHIDPSPLSRCIRNLEEELGVPLFVRLPRRLRLTPAGTKLLVEWRKLLIRLERVKRAVRYTHALYQAPLSIGVADGIAQPRLSECLNRWRSVAPEVPLEIAEMRAHELACALRSEEVDVGFSFGMPNDEASVQMPAWRYHVMALLPRDHELTAKAVMLLQELLAFPLLSCNEERLPGLVVHLRAIVRKHTEHATLAGAANTLAGYVTRSRRVAALAWPMPGIPGRCSATTCPLFRLRSANTSPHTCFTSTSASASRSRCSGSSSSSALCHETYRPRRTWASYGRIGLGHRACHLGSFLRETLEILRLQLLGI